MRELKLIEQIKKRAGRPGKGVKVGIGDDCAVLEYDSTRYLLWATDMLVEGTHFDKRADYKKIGRKAVAVNISDIAAMGGCPKYITVSLGIPSGLKDTAVQTIYDGIFNICGEYGIKIVGGDTNRSGKLIIDVSIIGLVKKEHLVRRSGAREGDAILITGPVRNGKKEHLDFSPCLKESRFLAGKYKISSMIDVSDGIAMDMGRICSESGVGCQLHAGDIPLSKGLSINDALYYGESFELLFTTSKKQAKDLLKRKKTRYFIIGEVVSGKNGLKLINGKGRAETLKMKGFEHI
ncbi:thiamine-monophosphate kinase [Candidatus Omnitrophota bacterium]